MYFFILYMKNGSNPIKFRMGFERRYASIFRLLIYSRLCA